MVTRLIKIYLSLLNKRSWVLDGWHVFLGFRLTDLQPRGHWLPTVLPMPCHWIEVIPGELMRLTLNSQLSPTSPIYAQFVFRTWFSLGPKGEHCSTVFLFFFRINQETIAVTTAGWDSLRKTTIKIPCVGLLPKMFSDLIQSGVSRSIVF